MYAGSNKRHSVSPHPSRKIHYPFYQEIRTIKPMKFFPNSSPQEDLCLKNNPDTNANPNVKKDDLHALRLSGTLRDGVIKSVHPISWSLRKRKWKREFIPARKYARMSILIITGNYFWTTFLRSVSVVGHPNLKFEKFEIRKVIASDSHHGTLGFFPNLLETNRRVTSLPMRLWRALCCKQRPTLPLQVFPSP